MAIAGAFLAAKAWVHELAANGLTHRSWDTQTA